MQKFFEHDGDRIIFSGDVLKIYLPKNYFESKIAEYNGDSVNTIGFFFFEVKSNEMDENDKDGRFYTLKLPAKIDFEFNSEDSITKNIKETGDILYTVFTLEKGSTFIKNINVVQSAANAKDFIYMLHGGRFPAIIPYDEIIDLYVKNLNLNALSLGCQSFMYELMIGELMRWKEDPKIAFRKAINQNDVNQLDYQNINMKNIAFFNSTYSSIAFEDINKAIINSIAKTERGDKEIISPVEKTIKY